ncbi:MAG TPA: bifunctional diaminohydroxyphosphoribosylaminopyrimidine deaminase/5-amino-6-(5-phosphoribosylamino)uracil reductase RibD [Bacteroidales bacterium]|nr:bifunctional diaminohydroxyphosphoribosylaminopyrimidine deaminase/5-amino-6-(5-phosphoribosylamino)uracil reductase RibD [Bacteroidales bacterium]
MTDVHEKYISRCLELARKGLGSVSPNPMVGSVIVYKDRIIGEGYHRKCGEAHAEVNAVNSVSDKSLLKKSTIYVSLEPCSHFGKTPPCTDMIIRERIPKIVVGSIDPYFKVAGKGIEKLKTAGREVITGVLEKECIELNKRFYTFHTKKRPYIILKWAQTKDGYIDYRRESSTERKASWITNEYCRTLVHKWRTEEDAFLVGTNTVLLDNPQLTSRNWFGRNPLRITIDKDNKLDRNLRIFDNQAETMVFNLRKDYVENNISLVKIDFSIDIIPQILEILFEKQIQSIVVEGGLKTLQTFIDLGLWDEARVFTGDHVFGNGVPAPIFDYKHQKTEFFDKCTMDWYFNPQTIF